MTSSPIHLSDPTRHNWWQKLNALTAELPLVPGVHRVWIRHSVDCAHWAGDYCDCDPEIEITSRPDKTD